MSSFQLQEGPASTQNISNFFTGAIPNCVLWLDANDATTISYSSGSNVSQWNDKSGNGNNGISQGTPTWSSNGLNGLPSIAFNGTTSCFAGSITSNSGTTCTMVVTGLLNQGAGSNNYARLISCAVAGSGTDYQVAGTAWFGRSYLATNPQSITSYRVSTYLSYQAIVYGVPFVAVSIWDGTSNTTYVNGTTTGSVASSGSFGYNAYNIGRTAGGILQPDSVLLGSISEVMVFNGALTTIQRQQIEGYLTWKWIPPPTMLAYFPFDGTTTDYFGNVTLTTIGTMSYVAGQKGQAVYLSNQTNTANTTYSANLLTSSYNLPTTFTISLWFYPLTVTSGRGSTLFASYGTAGAAPNYTIGGYFAGGTMYSAFNGIQNNGGGGSVAINTWYHFALTYSNNTLTLYLNGAQGGSAISQAGAISGFQLGCGQDGGGPFPYWGYIDDFRIYTSVLTATQIQNIYRESNGGILPTTHPYGLSRSTLSFGVTITTPFLSQYLPVTAFSAQIVNQFLTSPRQITSCAAWFDSADATTFTYSSGSNISQWNDKSGNAYSVIQPTVAYQPTNTAAGVQLSLTTFLYQVGSNMPNFSASAETTVFIVARNGTSYSSSGSQIINSMWFTNTTAATARYHVSFANGLTPGVYLLAGGGTGQTTAVALGQTAVIAISIAAAGIIVSVNGSTASFSGLSLTSANNTTWFMFGDARQTYTTDVIIKEFAGYNVALTASQRQQMETYLAWKWGLQSLLPSGHPGYQTGLLSYFNSLSPISLFSKPPPVLATGGTMITRSAYTYHLFTSSGTFTLSNTGVINYLVVGGGGGGGSRHGGGGGGGGVLTGSWSVSGTYTITVGTGGTHGVYGANSPSGAGYKGGDTTIATVVTAYGGGGGGTYDGNATDTLIGSGGGGGGNSRPGIAGTAGQGNAGGSGNNPAGGGGGGAATVGSNANAGIGGDGTSNYSSHLLNVGYGTTFATAWQLGNVGTSYNVAPSSFLQNPVSGGVAYIGAGGGGASAASGSFQVGGKGGGGTGDWDDTYITGGTDNTGGGGGASRANSGVAQGRNGGSGLVLLWY